MLAERSSFNPLISPEDVIPSRPELMVKGVCNAGATTFGDEILLLLRVMEAPAPDDGMVFVPVLDLDGRPGNAYRFLTFRKDDPDLDSSDPRVVSYRGRLYLTVISHLRLARSVDGVNFSIDPKPTIMAQGPQESYGIEDARVTLIDDTYYITYVAVSHFSYTTSLMTTTDWSDYQRRGAIFHPQNKDVVIFPERINGAYFALHRPDPGKFGLPAIWIARSPDLLHWGDHRHLLGPSLEGWDAWKVGAGAPPIATERGWLEIYHGVSHDGVYGLAALLLDGEDPSRVIACSPAPLLVPETMYEIQGFFSNTVFTDGVVRKLGESDRLLVYYGASDQYVCMTEFSIQAILDSLGPCKPAQTQGNMLYDGGRVDGGRSPRPRRE